MASVYELFIEAWFSAAHRLDGYPGDCANLHGHNWKVAVHVACRELDALGMGIDFRDLKIIVAAVVDELDHGILNDHPAFKTQNPTAENIARHIYREVAARRPGARVALTAVAVTESPGVGVIYREE